MPNISHETLNTKDKEESIQLLTELITLAQGHAGLVYKSLDIMPEDRDALYEKYTQIAFRAIRLKKKIKQYKTGEQI